MTTATDVELPSGKDEAYENFPVGSWLLPAKLRPHVATFYGFARTIDDIADSAEIPAEEKLRRLDGFAAAITGEETDDPAYDKAHRMRDSLAETGITRQHCLDLIAAFKQDAVKLRYDDWDDLMGYCILSAAPVGRYLIDLHGGSKVSYGPSDALCNALQVLNHLQDLKEDYQTLDRVYLPGEWMAAQRVTVKDLAADLSNEGLRTVISQALDRTAGLMTMAAKLPSGLASRRLAMESHAIINIANHLVKKLRQEDPIAGRVALSKGEYLSCCVRGAAKGLFA